jgi:hypothetical protein
MDIFERKLQKMSIHVSFPNTCRMTQYCRMTIVVLPQNPIQSSMQDFEKSLNLSFYQIPSLLSTIMLYSSRQVGK